ncbi:putative nuclease HARBI1 [Leptopilina boulardi]|uniref:putative nuclease HARBI1 n=1 Tax=Leptopilina boulardi TaxID=63433 RepID=UPI0021F5A40C|nr:putative nuclease HARBI1 [Leptopilina boulardi]
MEDLYENFLSSSDDEDLLPIINRRPRIIKDRINYMETFDDVDFVRRFRLSKNTVNELLIEIQDQLQSATQRNHAISPIIQVLLTLRYYATGSHFIAAGDFSGVSKSSAHRIVHRVTAAIARLAPDVIKLPASPQEISATQIDFYAIARFPRVIAAFNCTHIKVQSFGGNEAEIFRNRKGYFSINVQATCDANLKFSNIVARWPGSAHDATILNNSRLRGCAEAGEFGDGIILADGGYNMRSYLLTPLSNPATPAQNLYNESQIRTRNTIERAFGVWKRRFPCLAIGMRFTKDHVLPVIVATAVLHNLARITGEEQSPDDPDLNINWDEILNADLHNRVNLGAGEDLTLRLLLQYFESLVG